MEYIDYMDTIGIYKEIERIIKEDDELIKEQQK